MERIRRSLFFCLVFLLIAVGTLKLRHAELLTSDIWTPKPKFQSLFERYNFTGLDLLIPLHTPRPYFKFLMVPTIAKHAPNCMKSQKIKWSMVVTIRTHFNRHHNRQAIRTSWGSIRLMNGVRILVFFIVSRADSPEEKELLRKEQKNYGDLLQLDMEESYRGVGYKFMAAMQWAGDNFSDDWIHFVGDDDIIPDFETLFTKMESLFNRAKKNGDMLNNLPIHCAFRFIRRPKVDRKGKWIVNTTEYPLKWYPPTCLGGFYGMSVKLAKAIYNASRHYPFFRFDDVYLTGFMRLEVCDTRNEFQFSKLDQFCAISTLPGSNFQHVHVGPSEYAKLWEENEKWLNANEAKICRRTL